MMMMIRSLRAGTRAAARAENRVLARAPTLFRSVSVSVPTAKDVDDMHDDFKTQYKVDLKSGEEVQKAIDEMVKSHKVVVFMKGTPQQPMCGFSQMVAAILDTHLGAGTYKSVNVLDDDAIRQGIKEYGSWPTIPQLYVNGELVGGCDIVTNMHREGELGELLSEANATER